MMTKVIKAKVIKRFRDKKTKKLYVPIGKNSAYEGTEERVKELEEAGYVKVESFAEGKSK